MINSYIKFKNYIFVLFLNAVNLNIFNTAQAQSAAGEMDAQTMKLNENAGFVMNMTVGGVLAMVIKGFLGLLGIIFLFLIIIAGYNWMTAAGDEEKVNKAKETIQRAIIGIIIIISAYAITYFVFKNLGGVGGGGAGGGGSQPIFQ